MRKKIKVITVTLFLGLMLVGCNKAGEQAVVPTSTQKPVPNISEATTPTPSTPTSTPTAEPTEEAIITPSETEEGATSVTPTVVPTVEPSATPTAVPTVTNTPVPTATNTPVPTATSTPIPTSTPTPSPEPTATSTPTPSPTAVPTAVPTLTPTPRPTNTPIPTPTPRPTSTPTPIVTPTTKPVPTQAVTNKVATYVESTYTFDINNGVFGKEYYDGNNLSTSSLSTVNKKCTLSANLDYYKDNKMCYGYIKSGVTITVVKQSSEWTYVKTTNKSYYVRTDELNRATSVENSTENVTYDVTQMNATMYASKVATIYAKPDTTSSKIGSLPKDTEILVTGKTTDNNWYRISYNGTDAFVTMDCLTTKKPVTEESGNANSGNTGTNENNNNENTSSGTPTTTPTPTVKPTEVPKPTVTPTPTVEPTPTPEPTYTITEMNEIMICGFFYIEVFDEPYHNVIGSLGMYNEVLVTGKTDNGWYRIEANGNVGFVWCEDLIPPIIPERTPDEVLSMMKAAYEEAGLTYSLDVMTPEEVEMFGPTDGMGWGLCPIDNNTTYEDLLHNGQRLIELGYKVFYLEYIETLEDGTIVIKSYSG